MNTIIAGSRYYEGYFIADHLTLLEQYKTSIPITRIISGGCRGVDKNAIQWAKDNNLPFEEVMADWSIGKKAGYERNRAMAKMAEAIILFPGEAGTMMMGRIAKEHQLKIYKIPSKLEPFYEDKS